MLLVQQAGTFRRRLPGEGENKDSYKHKSKTDGKYHSTIRASTRASARTSDD
jgi:hypothetical protein